MGSTNTAQSTNGIVIGEVCNLEDPDKLGRVQVTFPHLGGVKSHWAKLVSPMAGKKRGFFFRPEVGDEVLVAFEQNDSSFPYILGALWSQADAPPPSDSSAKDNNHRFIHSRSGHIIRFDDTKGEEKIEIIDKDAQRRIVIDCQQKKIRIEADQGDVEIMAKGDVKVTQAANVEINAKANITVKAQGNLNLEATGKVTIKGATVAIN
ncbi:MAG: phage tail protein [Anaerolineae bacterium]|nr:phage tail protein [Anaerolineae bacterium]